MSADAEPWEAKIRRYLDFLINADSDEDLIAVLRGHLYIEIALTELLEANAATAKKLREKTTYSDKIRLTERHSILEEADRNMLYKIGLLRNRLCIYRSSPL